jgi:hypothetical protein
MNAPTPDLPGLVPVTRDIHAALLGYRDACRACLDCHRAAVKGDPHPDAFALSREKWNALAVLECALGELP